MFDDIKIGGIFTTVAVLILLPSRFRYLFHWRLTPLLLQERKPRGKVEIIFLIIQTGIENHLMYIFYPKVHEKLSLPLCVQTPVDL